LSEYEKLYPMNEISAKRAAVIFIFINVVLNTLALGIVIPILPKLVEGFLGGNTGKTAEIIGIFATVWAAAQFFCSPILGVLSDRYGRRPIILLSSLGLGIDYIFMALAPTVGLLFIGRIISGITTSDISAAGAYISDVTPAEKRAQGFGMIGMAFGIGLTLGPAIGGILGEVSPRLPFWGAAALSLMNTLYGFFVLPESLAIQNRVKFSWKKANPIGSLNLLRSHTKLFSLAMIGFIIALAHVALPSIFVLYASYRYGWNVRAIGLTLAGFGVCSAITQGGLVDPIIERLGEQKTLLLGLLFGVMGFAEFAYAPTGPAFLIGIPLLALWGLANAVAQGMMTEHVSPTEQGRLQGANGSLRGIAELVGPGIFAITFSRFITSGRNLPGAPFYLAAALLIIAMLVAWRSSRTAGRSPQIAQSPNYR
jgi:MFS transporter, DHA1 family, tetracycline resistance protein